MTFHRGQEVWIKAHDSVVCDVDGVKTTTYTLREKTRGIVYTTIDDSDWLFVSFLSDERKTVVTDLPPNFLTPFA